MENFDLLFFWQSCSKKKCKGWKFLMFGQASKRDYCCSMAKRAGERVSFCSNGPLNTPEQFQPQSLSTAKWTHINLLQQNKVFSEFLNQMTWTSLTSAPRAKSWLHSTLSNICVSYHFQSTHTRQGVVTETILCLVEW